MLFPQIQWNCI